MKKPARRGFLDFIEEKLDGIGFYYGRFRDYFDEVKGDLIWIVTEKLARMGGISIVSLLNGLFPDVRKKDPLPVRLLRLVIGLPLLLTMWVLVQVFLSAAALLGGLLGLRRGREYSLKENVLVWTPLLCFSFSMPFIGISEYLLGQITLFLSYSTIVLGLNVLLMGGQLSLGHGVFVMVGAYATAIFSGGAVGGIKVFSFASILLGGVVCSLIGLVIGFPASRVKGPYLALLTLGLMISVPLLLKARFIAPLTGGADGLTFDMPPPPPFLSFLTLPSWLYVHALLVFILMFVAAHVLLRRTKVGRAFVAIREGEEKCSVLGINVPLYKMLSFSISAFYAGVGGGILAFQTGYISPNFITVRNSLDYMVALVLGGRGSLFGSAVGGAFLSYQVFITSWLAKWIQNGDQLLWGINGLVLVLSMILVPRGLAGEIAHRVYHRSFRLPSRRKHRRDPFPDYDREEELMAAGVLKYAPEERDAKLKDTP